MTSVVFSATSIVDLEKFMLQELCSHERLDLHQVRTKRSLMRQGNQVVGLTVRVEGPRLMRSQAIWAERENKVFFYDSAGKRFAVVKLLESPGLES